MKLFASTVCAALAYLAACQATPSIATASASANASGKHRVHVSIKHHQHHHDHGAPSRDAPSAADKSLFHVRGTKASFDALFASSLPKTLGLDVWRIHHPTLGDCEVAPPEDTTESSQLHAEIYMTHSAMKELRKSHVDVDLHTHGGLKAVLHKKVRWEFALEEEVEIYANLIRERKEVDACVAATSGFLADIPTLAHYTDSAFFDCYRPYGQVFAFLDALMGENDSLMVKYPEASRTYEGISIPAYLISTTRQKKTTKKKALYTQALMHAREWQGGAATFFTMASILDALRAGDADITALFEEYDWYFVPIVNIDGYKFTWEEDRYWRTNRHPSASYDGVDLNRNFGPDEYFNLEPSTVDAETNPGPYPLSEPESAGIHDFILQIDNLAGLVDMHTYGGMVLRPFSDAPGEEVEPYASAMKQLGDAVAGAFSTGADCYKSQTADMLYPAYGCFDDGFYREFNFTIPAITVEMAGTDFTSPQSSIRPVGATALSGLLQFATEASAYRVFIEELQAQG